MSPIHVTTITLALDDEQVARLRQLAEQRGATVERVAESLLDASLTRQTITIPVTASALPSTLALAGIIIDPTIAPLSAREIDDVLAGEAMNLHDAL